MKGVKVSAGKENEAFMRRAHKLQVEFGELLQSKLEHENAVTFTLYLLKVSGDIGMMVLRQCKALGVSESLVRAAMRVDRAKPKTGP